MSAPEQLALLDDDLRPTIRRAGRASYARLEAEIEIHLDGSAAAEATSASADGDEPTGDIPRNRYVDALREELARSLHRGDDEDGHSPVSSLGLRTTSSPRRYLDLQENLAHIAGGSSFKHMVSGYQFKGLFENVVGGTGAFAAISAHAASAAAPHMRVWKEPLSPLADMAARVGAEARLHEIGTMALGSAASLPSVQVTAGEIFKSLAPESPMFTSLLSAANMLTRTVAGTSGLLGTAVSASEMLKLLSPGSPVQAMIDGIVESSGLSQSVRHFAEGIATRTVLPGVDMSAPWGPTMGLSIRAGLLQMEGVRLGALQQEIRDAYDYNSPGLDVDVDAIPGRILPPRNVLSRAWDDVDEDDLAAALVSDVEHSLTDPDSQTLQRVLAAEQRQQFVDAYLHPFTSLDETLKVLGFDARARERMAPLLATTAGALAFVLFMLDHVAGGHVKALKDAGGAACKTYGRVDDWARTK